MSKSNKSKAPEQAPAEQTAAQQPQEQQGASEAAESAEGAAEGEHDDAGVNQSTDAQDQAQDNAKPSEAAEGMVLMKHESIGSISHGGESYRADEHGVFAIRAEHANELAQLFGLVAA